MMKKIKNLKNNTMVSIVVIIVFALLLTSAAAVINQSNAEINENEKAASSKMKKPGKVTGLKKMKTSCTWDGYRNVSSVKISFKKVKGVTGYQVLIYQRDVPKGYKTPLLYAKNTKKTTYTIKDMVPNHRYTIKVRAYKKDKKGKITYGKISSIKVKTPGQMKGQYYTCGTCITAMPGNMNRITEHGESIDKIYPNEQIHAGGSYFWK